MAVVVQVTNERRALDPLQQKALSETETDAGGKRRYLETFRIPFTSEYVLKSYGQSHVQSTAGPRNGPGTT